MRGAPEIVTIYIDLKREILTRNCCKYRRYATTVASQKPLAYFMFPAREMKIRKWL